MAIAKVEPLTTARALRGPFDYRLPERLGEVGVGTVLRVPFGRQRLLGVVVGLAERSELPPERLAEPLEALEAGATPELVRLGLWVAREYCSTPSRGLSLVLPPGTGAGGRRVRTRMQLLVEPTDAGLAALDGGGRLGSRQRAVLEALREGEQDGGEALRPLRRRSRHPAAPRGTRPDRDPQCRASAAAAGACRGCLGTAGLADPRPERCGEPGASSPRRRGAESELLLHGVTGSGKTEVYLAAAEAALARAGA